MWWVSGCGRSDVKRLNSVGERIAPCGTPFLMLTVRDFLFL